MLQRLVILLAFGFGLVVAGDGSAGGLRGVNTSNIFVTRDHPPSLFRILTVGSVREMDEGGNSTDLITEESIACIPIEAGRELDDIYDIALPSDFVEAKMDDIDAGKLFVSISRTLVLEESVVVLEGAHIEVVRDPRTTTRSVKPPAVGLKSLAVVLISTRDSFPSVDAETLRHDLFSLDKVNLKTQYRACSFGQLDWELYNDRVLEVFVDEPISKFKSGASLVSAAQQVLRKQMNVKDFSTLADKTLMCLPPGTGRWIASSGVGHWRAQFNDGWCLSLTATMHELGHTIGLNHANEGGVAYGDSTGYMAAGHRAADWPRKCFNGQKNWQLGWFFRRQHSVSPEVLPSGRLIKLATFVDYNIADYDEPVLIEIDDMYLQFNKAKAFNIETEEKQNQVTITRKTKSGSDALSGLSVGDVYAEFYFGKPKRTLVVEACDEITGRRGADVMVISVALDKSLCEEYVRNQEATISAMDVVNDHLANVESTTVPDDENGYAHAVLAPTLGPTRFSVRVQPTPSPSKPETMPPTMPPTSEPLRQHKLKPTPTTAPTLWSSKSLEQVSNFWSLLDSWRNQEVNSSTENDSASSTATAGFALSPTPASVEDKLPEEELDVIEASDVGSTQKEPSLSSVFTVGEPVESNREQSQHQSGVQSIFSTRGSS